MGSGIPGQFGQFGLFLLVEGLAPGDEQCLSPVTPPAPPMAAARARAIEAVPLQCQTACGDSHVTIM
jgi:hypothetical protein